MWFRVDLFRGGWRGAIIAGLLSGVGWALSYPPVSIWPAVVLIVWPALWLAERTARQGGSAWHAGMWFGLGTIPAWAWLTRWAAQGAPAGFPLLVCVLAFYCGLMVWAVVRCRRSWPGLPMMAVAPVIWVGIEFLRGRVAFDGFPWYLVSHPLIDAPMTAENSLLAWPAMFIGTFAVSGLLVLAVAGVDRVIRSPGSKRMIVGVGILLLVWPAGSLVPWVLPATHVAAPVVGIVQTNVPQSIRTDWTTEARWEDWLTMRSLLIEAARGNGRARPDVIVTPETMFPGFVLQEDAARAEREVGAIWRISPDPASGEPQAILAETVRVDFLNVQARLGIPVLIGSTRHEGFELVPEGDRFLYTSDRHYNSVFHVENGRVGLEAYDKQHLTPFGEIMPYISNWPRLENWLLGLAARGMRFDMEEGEARTVFPIETPSGRARIVTPICFEASIAYVCRDLVFEGGRRRADLMVNMTNDGWFYDAAGGREIHELSARWRCVELATPMIRAANTGISSLIDRRGRVIASLEPWREGVLVEEVRTGADSTVYARTGDAAGWICFGLTIFGLALTYTGMGRRNRTDLPGDDEKVGKPGA